MSGSTASNQQVSTSSSDSSKTATAPGANAIACLTYEDAPRAIQFIADVLGARVGQRHDGPDGTVAHAELWFGASCVMLGTRKNDRPLPDITGRGIVYVVLESRDAVDALHERVAAAGAPIPIALHDTDYGSRDFACADPEGNAWSFGTYAPSPPAC